jgi:hypothetical protein
VKHPDRTYHVLLDEMNLAHVEYYLAQVLSAMEGDGRMVLPDVAGPDGALSLPLLSDGTPLLHLCGTVNIDETTQVLSDKVVDRANVIEISVLPPPAEIDTKACNESITPEIYVSLAKLQEWRRLPEKLTVPDEIREVWKILSGGADDVRDAGGEQGAARRRPRGEVLVGRRIIRDITIYVAYAERLRAENPSTAIGRSDAIDLQIVQRILPKIRGDMRLHKPLEALSRYLRATGLTRAYSRLERILSQLEVDQFVTYWS